MLTIVGSAAWADDVSIGAGTFDGKNATYTTGWSTTGTGVGRNDCVIIGYGENITSPAFDLSGYSQVTISIKARRFGSLAGSKATIDVSIGGTSVGTTDATGTNATTSLTDITFTPSADMTSAVLVFTCTNATSAGSTHGAGINSITITGTPLASSVAAPTFSPVSGTTFGDEGLSVTISQADGKPIYYNINSDENPTSNSTAYTGPIALTATSTIKAIAYDGEDASNVATATYTYVDPNASGTQNNPYTVAEARAAIDAGTGLTDVYATGIISKVDSYNSSYNSITYWISDDGTTTDQLQVYSGKGLNNTNFTSIDDVAVGATVVVYGTLKKYNSTYEFDRNNYLVSYTAPAVAVAAPTFSPAGGTYTEAQSVTISCTTENATIYYTTDGSEPSNQSTPYTDAISVSETTTIKAIAYDGQGNSSNVASATYTIIVAQDVVIVDQEAGTTTFLFNTPANEWGLPKGSSNKLVDETEYTANGYTIKVAGSSGQGFYYNTSGYLLMGKTGAYLTLPAFDFPVSKIEVVGTSGTSTSVKQNIYVGENAASTETTGYDSENNYTNSYDINEDYQAAGNIYTLKVTNNYNTQIVSIIVYRGEEPAPQPKYYVAGTWTNWGTNMIEMTKNADGTYTLDGQELENGAQFKIVYVSADETQSIWCGGATTSAGNYVVHKGWCTDIELRMGGGENFEISANGTNTYTFIVDPTDATAAPKLSITGWPETQYYLVGDFNQWSISDETLMTKNADGTYTFTQEIALDEKFKIKDSDGTWYGAISNDYFWVETDDTYSLTSPGQNFIMKVENDKAWTVVFNPTAMTLKLNGWPIVLDGNAFVKVTSTDDLTDGYYLIVNEDNSVAFDGSLETNLDAEGNSIDVTIVNNSLIVANSTTNASVVTIAYDSENEGYSVQTASGIYIGTNSNSNELKTNTSTPFIHTITFDEGDALLTGSAGAVLRYNSASNQLRFRYYKSSSYTNQKAVQLYKLTTIEDEEIPVTIGSTGYGTLYYGTRELTIPEGVTAKYVSSVENGKITFTELSDVIPAGTGVVINGEPGDYVFVAGIGTATAPEGNMLLGFDEAAETVGPDAETDYKFYMLSRNAKSEDKSVGFYFAKGCPNGEAFTNGAHKAYLAVPTEVAGAKSFYLFSDASVADGIGAIQSSMFNVEGAKIFNLNGQRVSTPQRGIYIVNGKKVLVK